MQHRSLLMNSKLRFFGPSIKRWDIINIIINVTRTQSVNDLTLITVLKQSWTISRIMSNSSTYHDYVHDPWPNQAVPCQPSLTRSMCFYLSPYYLSPQPVILCTPIPSHLYLYAPHAHIILVVHGLPPLPRSQLPDSPSTMQFVPIPQCQHYWAGSVIR